MPMTEIPPPDALKRAFLDGFGADDSLQLNFSLPVYALSLTPAGKGRRPEERSSVARNRRRQIHRGMRVSMHRVEVFLSWAWWSHFQSVGTLPRPVFTVVIGNDVAIWLWAAPEERIVHENVLFPARLEVAGDQDEMSNLLSGPLNEDTHRKVTIDLSLNLRKCHRAPVLRIRVRGSVCREMIYGRVTQGVFQGDRLIAVRSEEHTSEL